MKFAFVRSHQEWSFPWKWSAVLGVSRSAAYAWLGRAPSVGARRREELTQRIRQVHRESREVYGYAPRIHRQLRSWRAMLEEHGGQADASGGDPLESSAPVRRAYDRQPSHPIAPNRLNRQFRQGEPNRVWVADITYIATDEGWLYLAVVLDLYSRRVVGWATSDSLAAELSCQALRMAVRERSPIGGVLHHSDRGVQYAWRGIPGDMPAGTGLRRA